MKRTILQKLVLLIIFFQLELKSEEGWKVLNEVKPYEVTIFNGTEKKNLTQLKAFELLQSWNVLETGDDGKLKIAQGNNEIYIFSNSNLSLANGQYYLNEGTVRLIFESVKSLEFMTPNAHLHFEGKDLVFNYDSDSGRTEATLIDGKGWIKGIYREEELILEAGHRGIFQGVIEKGEPSFDFMLKGKKVARGDLKPRLELSQNELLEFNKKMTIENQKVILKVKPKAKPGQICSEPFAKHNECFWKCNLKSCIRKRCFANGIWGDEIKVKLSSDKKQIERIAPCDY